MTDHYDAYPSGPITTVKLEHAIPKTDPPVREVHFWRRFSVGDMVELEEAGRKPMHNMVDMLRRTTLLSTADIMGMDAVDFQSCSEVANGFLEPSPQEGRGKSESP